MLAGSLPAFTGCGQGAAVAGACPVDGPTCEGNVLLTCGDAGVVETPCEPGRCAFDAPVPQCVPAAALPCEPSQENPTCENGLLVTCEPEAAYRLAVDCGEGAICTTKTGTAACRPIDEEFCRPGSWQPLCVSGRRIECDAARRRLYEAGDCTAP
ncbi:hypothetical protein L6V77_00975 [Myxococcota bacterium]|nr:hypothetical protein [Myxococcota bacterium]